MITLIFRGLTATEDILTIVAVAARISVRVSVRTEMGGMDE
jgi:hypothetical protein